MPVHSHRSVEFSCPHCGKVCDSNTGTSSNPDDKSIGICVECIEPFWLLIVSRKPLTFKTEKISAAEYEEFGPADKKLIADYQKILLSRNTKKKESVKHAAFLKIMATLVEEFQIDFPTVLLMFAYYPLPALDGLTEQADREYAAALFDRYVELSHGVIDKPFEYVANMFAATIQMRNAAEFIFRR